MSSDDSVPEERLVPASENVHRQIVPGDPWFYNGRPTLKVFDRSSNDAGRLSVSRGAVLTAYGSFLQRVCEIKKGSAGTLSLEVAAVESFGSRVVDDYSCASGGVHLGHAFIDFRGLDRTQRKALAQNLLTSSTVTFAP